MIQAVFVIISALGLLAALGTVLARNLVHAGLFLIAFFFVIACQFVLLEAEFLAAVQVLVYIGAVAILLMFGIMLTRNVQGDDTTTVPRGWIVPGAIAALGLLLVLVYGINNQQGVSGRIAWSQLDNRPPVRYGDTPSARAPAINGMGQVVGEELLTRYAVPFEVAGLLLTAALVGAIALAHRDTDETEARRSGIAAEPATNGQANGTPAAAPVSESAAASAASSHS